MQVAIYIYKDDVRYRLELFQDENISITSSIQNVNDIIVTGKQIGRAHV